MAKEAKTEAKVPKSGASAEVLADNGRTRVEVEQRNNILIFRANGFIDEDINFSVVIDKLRALPAAVDTLRFDLGGVVGLNSCGVREWIILMERLPQGPRREFAKVSGVFIEQANMVPSMFGKGPCRVLSFQAPYCCEKCEVDHQILIEPGQVSREGKKFVAPRVACPKCSAPMVFDWIEDEYFSFLERQAL